MSHNYAYQDLKGADFSRKNLDAANFSGADLRSVPDLSIIRREDGLIRSDFTDASCRGADFTGADLSGAICIGTDFTAACLKGVVADGALFHDANFTAADTTDMELNGARFDGATQPPEHEKEEPQ